MGYFAQILKVKGRVNLINTTAELTKAVQNPTSVFKTKHQVVARHNKHGLNLLW